MSRWARCVFACAYLSAYLLTAQTSQAQNVSVRGQIFLPSGQPIQAVTRFTLGSDDARRNPAEVYYTDSQGRFYLQGLSSSRWYTITVESDGETHATTAERFLAVRHGYVPVNLRSLERPKPRLGPATVSASQLGHQPPKEAAKAYGQALQAIEKRQPEQAKENLRRALKLDPDFVNAYNELAVLEMGEKHYAEAESLLRQALAKDAEAPHALLNLGITFNYQGRYAEAAESLRKVLKLRPNWVAAHTYLGIALLESDQLKEAEPELARGTQGEGREQVLAYLYLGKLYAQAGQAEKAMAAWKSYLERDPDSPNAARVRSLMEQLRRQTDKPQ